jgi:hypothetical protein
VQTTTVQIPLDEDCPLRRCVARKAKVLPGASTLRQLSNRSRTNESERSRTRERSRLPPWVLESCGCWNRRRAAASSPRTAKHAIISRTARHAQQPARVGVSSAGQEPTHGQSLNSGASSPRISSAQHRAAKYKSASPRQGVIFDRKATVDEPQCRHFLRDSTSSTFVLFQRDCFRTDGVAPVGFL